MKNQLLTIVLSLFIGSQMFAQPVTARVQVIHNSAAAAAALVDVWISFDTTSVKLLSDFAYKGATPYVDAPAETDLTVSITAPNSNDTANAVFHKTFFLTEGETYLVIAAGDPGNNFDLFATIGLETPIAMGNTSTGMFHGSVDAPPVNAVEIAYPAGLLIEDFAFGEFSTFVDYISMDYIIQLQVENIAAAEFDVPFSAFVDSVVFVLASGYLNPAAFSSNNSFKLLAVMPSGTVIEINPKESTSPARLQIIHNCAVPAADSVDVYVNNSLLLDNFAFRNATPFINVPGATELNIDIVEKSASDNSSPLYSTSLVLESFRTYLAVASGVFSLGSETYDPQIDFEIIAATDIRESAFTGSEVDVLVFHGSTDAPEVTINEDLNTIQGLVSNLSYGDFASYLSLNPGTYHLELTVSSTGNTIATYEANLTGLEGAAITVLASGFVNPAANNNGAAFGLYLATANGGELIELPLVQDISVEEMKDIFYDIKAYPNPTKDWIVIEGLNDNSTINVYSATGSLIKQQFSGTNNQIDLSTFPNGLYLLEIRSGNQRTTRMINKI